MEWTYLPGGTGMLGMFEMYKVMMTSNVYFWGLGWWCSFDIWLSPTHRTRMVVTYSPGKVKPQGLSTVCQHTFTYIQENDLDSMHLRRLFELDFHAVLRTRKSR